ncbi:hypothetical protein [Streptomyces sp. NPDC054975]
MRSFIAVAVVGAALTMVATGTASAAPDDRIIVNQPVYIDHVQHGAQLVPTGWNSFANNTVQGYHPSFDGAYNTRKEEYQWVLRYAGASPTGEDTYQVRTVKGGHCLAVPGEAEENVNVQLKECSPGSWSQKWVFWDSETGVRNGAAISPALNPDLALTPTNHTVTQDFRVSLERKGTYLNQVWRTRAAG